MFQQRFFLETFKGQPYVKWNEQGWWTGILLASVATPSRDWELQTTIKNFDSPWLVILLNGLHVQTDKYRDERILWFT